MKIGKTIYFDHQASTPLDPQVFEAMYPYMQDRFGNPHSSEHVVGWSAMQAVEGASAAVAALIGADPNEIVFTSGATEANNLALLGVARHAVTGNRKHILLGAIEHKCVLEIGNALLNELGYSVTHIPVDSVGQIDMDMLEDALNDNVLLVSVMAVNNEIGTIQDISEISNLATAYGCLVHCDAAQAPCALDLIKFAQYVDLISLSGHKMYGPMGVGALFARRELQAHIVPVIHGGGQQGGLRSGTLPTALCVGFGAAAQLMTGNGIDERITLARRRDLFMRCLELLPCKIWFNGPMDPARRHPGNINIGFSGISAADLLNRVQPKLAASTGSACTSGILEPSHVLRSIGLREEDAASSVRFSLGRYTTDEDVREATDCLRVALEEICENGLYQMA